MIILALQTDNPEAEIWLFDNDKQLAYETWQAHRELAETLHRKIDDLLKSQNKELKDMQAIACYKGPGSFTGLRIGLSVANALASGLQVPIVGSTGDDWLQNSVEKLLSGQNDLQVLPEYGAPVHITKPKK